MYNSTIDKKSDKHGRNPNGIRLVVSRKADGRHVSSIRMREAITDRYILLTQMELSHINNCPECLCAFSALALVAHTDDNVVWSDAVIVV